MHNKDNTWSLLKNVTTELKEKKNAEKEKCFVQETQDESEVIASEVVGELYEEEIKHSKTNENSEHPMVLEFEDIGRHGKENDDSNDIIDDGGKESESNEIVTDKMVDAIEEEEKDKIETDNKEEDIQLGKKVKHMVKCATPSVLGLSDIFTVSEKN
eukprot:14675564-Ditylum_brightwellii.AAC.1